MQVKVSLDRAQFGERRRLQCRLFLASARLSASPVSTWCVALCICCELPHSAFAAIRLWAGGVFGTASAQLC